MESFNPLGTESAEAKFWLSASNIRRGEGGGGSRGGTLPPPTVYGHSNTTPPHAVENPTPTLGGGGRGVRPIGRGTCEIRRRGWGRVCGLTGGDGEWQKRRLGRQAPPPPLQYHGAPDEATPPPKSRCMPNPKA